VTVSWGRYFFKKVIVANSVAAAATGVHEVYIDQSKFKEKSLDWPEEMDLPLYYKAARTAFIDMGADLKKHPLKITPLNSKKHNINDHAYEVSTVHQDVLDGSYDLKLNPYYYNELSKYINDPTMGDEQFIYAICAHEAIHAIEKHDAINIYSSTLVTFTVVQFLNAFQVQLALILALQTFVFLATSAYIGRKSELRADGQAALNPLVRANLIAIFLAMQQQQQRKKPAANLIHNLFKHHPSILERKQALEEEHHKSSSPPGLD
jgi:hypothetical protein